MKSQMTAREWLGTLILLAFLAYLLLTQTGCSSVRVSDTTELVWLLLIFFLAWLLLIAGLAVLAITALVDILWHR